MNGVLEKMINEIKRRIKYLEKEIKARKKGKYITFIGRRLKKPVKLKFQLRKENPHLEGMLMAYKELILIIRSN